MKKSVKIGFGVLGIILFLFVFFVLLPKLLPVILTGCYPSKTTEEIDCTMQNFGLMGDSYGIFNALFSGLAFVAVAITLYHQVISTKKANLENRFYKMLDFQQSLISEFSVLPVTMDYKKDVNGKLVPKEKEDLSIINGRKSFVEFKIQLKYLLQTISGINDEKGLNLGKSDIADIAYSVFYYGSSQTWKPFMMEYLKDYPNTEVLVDAIIKRTQNHKKYILNRTNQNYMSVYCRNMYNAIKLIDSSSLLTENEKCKYVKMLRAQLCNAELYVLFFNLISRFGRKWIENGYVEKYQLIQNIPAKYCDGYEPKDYFPKIKLEGDERCRSPFREVIEKNIDRLSNLN